MAVKYQTDNRETRHRIKSVACDFCDERLTIEQDERGFVFSQSNHKDKGRGYDACEPCLKAVRMKMAGMLFEE